MQAVAGLKMKKSYGKVRVFFCLPAVAHLLRECFCFAMAATGFFPGSFFSVGLGVEGFVVGVVGQTLPFGVTGLYPAGL